MSVQGSIGPQADFPRGNRHQQLIDSNPRKALALGNEMRVRARAHGTDLDLGHDAMSNPFGQRRHYRVSGWQPRKVRTRIARNWPSADLKGAQTPVFLTALSTFVSETASGAGVGTP